MVGYEGYYLCRCLLCNFVFIQRKPTEKEIKDHYRAYSYASPTYISPITIKRYHQLLNKFEKYRQHNRILDVGCGLGFFLEIAKQRGWQVYGTEYSEKAVEVCKNKGLNVHEGVLNPNNYRRVEFDIITSFEVIEHINNPTEEITNIAKLLRTGGLLYCTTPNFNAILRYMFKAEYHIISYPEHLCYYTPRTLNNLIEKSGFKKKKILTTGISFQQLISKVKKPTKTTPSIAIHVADQKLRSAIERKIHLKLMKNIANNILNLMGIGMAMKSYFEKVK